jgi:hypothetical protein
MALPGDGLAAPVEEAAGGLDREFVDDGQQVAGRLRGCMDIQPGRCKGSRKCSSDRARMHGDTEVPPGINAPIPRPQFAQSG